MLNLSHGFNLVVFITKCTNNENVNTYTPSQLERQKNENPLTMFPSLFYPEFAPITASLYNFTHT